MERLVMLQSKRTFKVGSGPSLVPKAAAGALDAKGGADAKPAAAVKAHAHHAPPAAAPRKGPSVLTAV